MSRRSEIRFTFRFQSQETQCLLHAPRYGSKVHVWGGFSQRGTLVLKLSQKTWTPHSTSPSLMSAFLRPLSHFTLHDGCRIQQDNAPHTVPDTRLTFYITNKLKSLISSKFSRPQSDRKSLELGEAPSTHTKQPTNQSELSTATVDVWEKVTPPDIETVLSSVSRMDVVEQNTSKYTLLRGRFDAQFLCELR